MYLTNWCPRHLEYIFRCPKVSILIENIYISNQHMHCFLSVYPATNGFAGTWDLRSNYHVSLIGTPIIPLFTPNTLVHNKPGKALILFLRRVDYPIHMEVVLYYCCVNCSISNNGKFECIQTLLVVIVHLIGLSNTLRFWWGHIHVYCVWVTVCWWKLNSKCFSLHLIHFISSILNLFNAVKSAHSNSVLTFPYNIYRHTC